MTPLVASLLGHVDMVEHLISQRDLVSRQERIGALELLGAQCSYRLTRGAAPIFVRPLRRSQKYLFYVKTLNQTSYQDYCGARAGQHIKANFNPRHLKCIK